MDGIPGGVYDFLGQIASIAGTHFPLDFLRGLLGIIMNHNDTFLVDTSV